MSDTQLFPKLAMSAAIGAAILAGLMMALFDLRSLAVRSKLGGAARSEMLRWLSPLPPDVVMAIVMIPLWVAITALGGWLNTPANHRMHHSRAQIHRDVNLGAVLMIWDRLFSTYVRPEHPVSYGIAQQTPPRRTRQLYTGPWRTPFTR